MSLPLSDKTILITRSNQQSGNLKLMLEEKGATVLDLPLIQINLDFDPKTMEDVFSEMATYEWIVFTSPNGVHFFFDLFFKQFKDLRSIGPMRIASIGEATSMAIEKFHLQVDLVSKGGTSESLAKDMLATDSLDNTKVLVITGNLNSDILPKRLEQDGKAIVDTFRVYKTEHKCIEKHSSAKTFRECGADAILFTSPSTVHSFYKQAKHLQISAAGKVPIAGSMGPSTTAALKQYGIENFFEAKPHSLSGFVDALVEKCSK